MGHILRMNPVFKEMIWGGTKLKDIYGYEIPSDHTGECWAISAHKNGDCTIADGEYKGKTLSWLFENHRELFGNIEGDQFPLLVKIIDAKNDLSVQVHPDDAYAKEHENSLGKTECWFVLQADEGTKMVMGHHAKTKDEFVKAIENDDYDNLLNSFKIKAGDFFYIPSGTLHAICSGSLIYEAQQSSDITYRVYDYHRKDADGNERQLHVQQSIDVTNVPADIDQNKEFPQTILENGTKTRYVDSEFFKVDRYQLNGKNVIKNDEPFMMVSIIEGTSYKSSNNKVVSVNKTTGRIKGLSKGSARITAISNDGNIATYSVNVYKAPKRISSRPYKRKTVRRGHSFTVKVRFSKGYYSKKIKFSSSRKSVATVNSKGKVKAKRRGRTTITLKAFNGKKARVRVTVR